MHDDDIVILSEAALNEIARLAALYQPTPEQELECLVEKPALLAASLRQFAAECDGPDGWQYEWRITVWNGSDRYKIDRAEQARIAGRFSTEQLATYTAGLVELRQALDEAAWLGFLAPVSLGGEK